MALAAWSHAVTDPATLALELLGNFEPARLEVGHGVLERPQLVAQGSQPQVVGLVVSGELLVLIGDLRLQLLEAAVDRGELLLGGTAVGARERGGGGGRRRIGRARSGRRR